jgi:hypothetical protein
MKGALLVTASVVAAIRLRGEPVRSSPKLAATVNDSVHLARLVLAEVELPTVDTFLWGFVVLSLP